MSWSFAFRVSLFPPPPPALVTVSTRDVWVRVRDGARQFDVDLPLARAIVEHGVVKLEQAALHPVEGLELEEREALALAGVFLPGDEPDGGGLDGGEVFLEGGLCGCEREVSYRVVR